MHRERPSAAAALLEVTITEVENVGASRTVFARLGALRVAIKLFDEGAPAEPGMRCLLELPRDHSLLYAAGAALC
jgi:hypothetical protein